MNQFYASRRDFINGAKSRQPTVRHDLERRLLAICVNACNATRRLLIKTIDFIPQKALKYVSFPIYLFPIRIMKLNKLLLVSAVCLLAFNAFGQKPEKSYHQMSKEEALKVLTRLPFADEYSSVSAGAAVASSVDARDRADNTFAGQERGRVSRSLAPTPVIVRLHSALPVRQAAIRLQEIGAGYDKMDADAKKKFDASVAGYLECAICKDYYVVTMLKYKNSTMGVVDDGLFQTMKLDEFKGNMWLVNDKGEKRELEQFTAAKGPGDTSIFFFKRLDEKGNPLLTPENKDFRIMFNNTLRSGNNPYGYLIPSSFDFKVAKVIVDGKVAF